MLNTISALAITGILSASGATYITELDEEAKKVTQAYVDAAEKRFDQYETLLPGIVKTWDEQVLKQP